MPGSALATGPLSLYRALSGAATPLVHRHLRRRILRGREDRARLGERFGRAGPARPEGALVWLHGASVGESLSALPLIARIRDDWPQLNLLMTTGTVTSAKLMAERLPADVIHQYAPVDLPGAVSCFLDHWRPALGLIIESEFWPNLLVQANQRGVELVLVNGRVSARTYRAWRRFRPVIRHLLGRFSLVLAQSREDATHLRALGAPQPLRLGNLKFAAPPLSADPEQLEALVGIMGERPRWLAASTHPGEDEIVAAAHQRIARRHPDLLTVLVPRHPHRAADIAASLSARGLAVALRSDSRAPGPEVQVYVADTIGELGLWYRLCQIVFVGGSLIPKGGQNLIEPAKLGCAILCGPHMTNFLRVTEDLVRAEAVRQVVDGDQLASTASWLLEDDAARKTMIEAAANFANAQSRVLEDIIGALGPYLDRAGAGCGNSAG